MRFACGHGKPAPAIDFAVGFRCGQTSLAELAVIYVGPNAPATMAARWNIQVAARDA